LATKTFSFLGAFSSFELLIHVSPLYSYLFTSFSFSYLLCLALRSNIGISLTVFLFISRPSFLPLAIFLRRGMCANETTQHARKGCFMELIFVYAYSGQCTAHQIVISQQCLDLIFGWMVIRKNLRSAQELEFARAVDLQPPHWLWSDYIGKGISTGCHYVTITTSIWSS